MKPSKNQINVNLQKKDIVKNEKIKKEFDKKAFRQKMYNKKYKIQQWDNHRRKQMLRQLECDVASRKPNNNSDNSVESSNNHEPVKFRKNRNVENKVDRKEEMRKAREEKVQALEIYKKKKTEMYKKLSRKTKKGQPIMKDRLEMLLEKIQSSVG